MNLVYGGSKMLRPIGIVTSIMGIMLAQANPGEVLNPWTQLTAEVVLGIIVITFALKIGPMQWGDLVKLNIAVTKALDRNSVALEKQADAMLEIKRHCAIVNKMQE